MRKYPHEDDVARWLENWSRWFPPTGVVGGSGYMWGAAVRTSAYHSAPIPVMGGEAADTQRALERLAAVERAALEQHHLKPGRAKAKSKRLGLSIRAYQARLHLAHANFYELRCQLVSEAVRVGEENRRIGAGQMVRRLLGVRRG